VLKRFVKDEFDLLKPEQEKLKTEHSDILMRASEISEQLKVLKKRKGKT